jgi:hypothetical protein
MGTWLIGHRTYITAAIAGIDAIGSALGYWDESHFRNTAELVVGAVFLRLGSKNDARAVQSNEPVK